MKLFIHFLMIIILIVVTFLAIKSMFNKTYYLSMIYAAIGIIFCLIGRHDIKKTRG